MMARLILILWVTLFGGVLSAQAQTPSSDDVAAARLAYLDGNYDTVVSVLLPAAEAGDAVAQNVVANAYDDGFGVEQDFALALKWWEAAAAQDMDKAVYNLGVLYAAGRPTIPVDYDKAAAYYERAIALGYHFAMNNRARMYELGQGGKSNPVKALELYEQAIALGNADAMSNAALMYLNANGVDEDLGRALTLFRMGAERGNATSLSNLGAMYANAYGVAEDPLAAMALYRMSADAGHPRGAVNLAYALIEGVEAWRDPALGYGWCLSGLSRAKPEDAEEFQQDCEYLADVIGEDAARAGKELAPALP